MIIVHSYHQTMLWLSLVMEECSRNKVCGAVRKMQRSRRYLACAANEQTPVMYGHSRGYVKPRT